MIFYVAIGLALVFGVWHFHIGPWWSIIIGFVVGQIAKDVREAFRG